MSSAPDPAIGYHEGSGVRNLC